MTTHARPAWIFRRLLGIVYLCAFGSLSVQLLGLVGSGGILPARDFMHAAQAWSDAEALGLDRLRLVPTLFWLSAGDRFLGVVCAAGATAGALLVVGLAPLAAAAAAWIAYLSLSVVGQDFFTYQWDSLLLEAGFLALLVMPATWRDRAREAPPPNLIAVWLLRWLLFRLMMAAGVVKLASGDSSWIDLTALMFHFETQPLPTPLAWYVHQLPAWLLKALCAGVMATEILAPLLMFGGRRLRASGFALLVSLQAAIAATGNYAWFNLLSAALCVFLLDDGMLSYQAPAGRRQRASWVAAAATAVTVPASLSAFLWSFGVGAPGLLRPVADLIAPFRIANRYGLFAVITTTRPEIIVEGSEDGERWQPYEFKHKPGVVLRRPPWIAPHQPRLDWQMWFAALSTPDAEPWFRRFVDRLLEPSPEVMRLLRRDPFDGRRPRFIRARLTRYRFTRTEPSGVRPAAWWTAEPLGEYAPIQSRARALIPPLDDQTGLSGAVSRR